MPQQLDPDELREIGPEDVVFEDFTTSDAVGKVLRTLYADLDAYEGGSSKFGLRVSALTEEAGVSNSTAWRSLDEWYDVLESRVEDGKVILRPKGEASGEAPSEDESEPESPSPKASGPIPREHVEALVARYRVLSETASRELGGHEPTSDLDRMLYRNARVRRSMADQLIEDLEKLLEDEDGEVMWEEV